MELQKNPDFQKAFIALAATIAGMVGYIEEQIVCTIEGFKTHNPEKWQKASSYTPAVKKLSNETMQKIIELLLKFRPKGYEARLAIASWRMALSLERISVIIQEVSEDMHHLDLNQVRYAENPLRNIANHLLKQTYDLVISYTTDKMDKIPYITDIEKQIHVIYRQFFTESVQYLAQNPHAIQDVEKILHIAKNLSMIGGYMKEIAAQLIYKNQEKDK